MIDPSDPAIRAVIEAASRKGVVLDIRPIPAWARSPELVAAAVQVDVGRIVTATVFVAERRGGGLAPVVYLSSEGRSVDTGLLAALSGEIALRAATASEALDLVGHPIGSIPPFGHARSVPMLMDAALTRYQWIWAVAGSAAVFRVEPRTLRVLASAVVVPVPAQPGLVIASPLFGGDLRGQSSPDYRYRMAEDPLPGASAI